MEPHDDAPPPGFTGTPRGSRRPFGFMLVLILCGFFGFLGLLLYWNSGTILRDDSFLLGYFAPLVWLIAVVGPIVIALPRTRARFAWLTRHHADLWLILGLAVVSAYLFFQALGVRVTTIPLF